MKTKFRQRIVRNGSFFGDVVVFKSNMFHNKAMLRIKGVDNDFECERKMKGSIRILPMPYEGEYEFNLLCDSKHWNEKTYKSFQLAQH